MKHGIAVSCCLALVMLHGCDDTITTTETEERYSYDYHDFFNFEITTDTLHVTITQPASGIDTSVTFQPDITVEDASYLDGQIAINLTARTNIGSRSPTPVREFSFSGDSLSLWYAAHPKPDTSYATAKATGSGPAIQTSPVPVKYTIKKIELRKPEACFVEVTFRVARRY